MKKLIFSLLIVAASATVSCGSSKKATATPAPSTPAVTAAAPSGMVEEVVPLSGPQYRSDKQYYRAVQNGLSADRSMAQKIAMQNCRQELAAAIQADTKTVIETYAKSQNTGANSTYTNQYQEMAYTVINQSLADVQVVDEKIYRETSGQYRFYVCLQIPKADLSENIAKSIENEAKLKADFDAEQFKKIFNEKMAANVQ